MFFVIIATFICCYDYISWKIYFYHFRGEETDAWRSKAGKQGKQNLYPITRVPSPILNYKSRGLP